MTCFEGLLSLWKGAATAEAQRLPTPTAHGDQRNDEDLVLSVAAGTAQVESRQPEYVELDSSLADEAYEWTLEHVIEAPPAEESDKQPCACSNCGEVVLGVACRVPMSGLLHFGCAVAERKRMLLAREAKYLKQRRRELHQERWEAIRPRKKPKRRPRSSMACSAAVNLVETSTGRKMEEESCQGLLYKLIGAASSWAAHFRLDAFMSYHQMLKSWAGRVQREEAEETSTEAAKELLGCGEAETVFYDNGVLGCVAKTCRRLFASLVAAATAEAVEITKTRRRKRQVQRGSRGAHLARMAAAQRGVRLCRWSLVRQRRAVHKWAHASTFGSSLSFAFGLAAGVYKGARSMVGGFADFARGLWNGELRWRGTSMGELWPPETAMQGRRDAHQFARLVSLTTSFCMRTHRRTCHAHTQTYMSRAHM